MPADIFLLALGIALIISAQLGTVLALLGVYWWAWCDRRARGLPPPPPLFPRWRSR